MHTIRFSFWTWLRRVALAAALGVMPSQAGTYTVNTTADSGAGSLRQANQDAQADAGEDTITCAATARTRAAQTSFFLHLAKPSLI